MEEIKLDVLAREDFGRQKLRKLRNQNFVPGIIYGNKEEPAAIKFDRRVYEKIRRQHQGESLIFHLNLLDGNKKTNDYSAIIKEEQVNPVDDHVLHVDFKRIALDEEIEVKVRLTPVGEAIGVKRDGGALEHMIWELEIICLPTNIPQQVSVDVSNLAIGESIHLKDIKLPEGVRTTQDPEMIAFMVVRPMQEEIAPAEPGAPTEPEVIKEKKPAAEGEEAKAGEKPKAEAEKPAK